MKLCTFWPAHLKKKKKTPQKLLLDMSQIFLLPVTWICSINLSRSCRWEVLFYFCKSITSTHSSIIIVLDSASKQNKWSDSVGGLWLLLWGLFFSPLSRTVQLLSSGWRRASSYEWYANDIPVNTQCCRKNGGLKLTSAAIFFNWLNCQWTLKWLYTFIAFEPLSSNLPVATCNLKTSSYHLSGFLVVFASVFYFKCPGVLCER